MGWKKGIRLECDSCQKKDVLTDKSPEMSDEWSSYELTLQSVSGAAAGGKTVRTISLCRRCRQLHELLPGAPGRTRLLDEYLLPLGLPRFVEVEEIEEPADG